MLAKALTVSREWGIAWQGVLLWPLNIDTRTHSSDLIYALDVDENFLSISFAGMVSR